MERLREHLRRIDGRGYPAYKDLRGEYAFPGFELHIDHVQGDPFARPSRIALVVHGDASGLPVGLTEPRDRRVATEDYLTRRVARALSDLCRGGRGSGKSGRVTIDRPGQEVLERTSCLIDGGGIEVRLEVGLPAAGRRVLGREAAAIFFEELPEVVRRSLLASAHDLSAMARHADAVEDQRWLRRELPRRGLVAFVAEGACLPRRSGVDDRPLASGALPFGPIPDPLRVDVELPRAGRVSGLGIPEGVTLVVGGGYHGKSTLLEALARGIYDHIPGDGRERVVSVREAATVRAEDGRRVERVGIDGFIGELPSGQDTRAFCTDRASGSTSQAAAVMEAVEAGARLLLIDEDTSASNFLGRDFRMQALVARDREPITPLVDRVRELYADHGVSTLLVLGGSSDYFEVADRVLQMDAYRPVDVSDRVRDIVAAHPTPRQNEAAGALAVRSRRVLRRGLRPETARGREKASARSTRAIRFGDEEIDITALSQIVDDSQARALADVLLHLHRSEVDDRRTMAQLVAQVDATLEVEGISAFAASRHGDRAEIRGMDVAAALNRLRTVQMSME